ncbi:MAG: hypothetical protein Q9174_005415 [Haloplaca sp. 1 TL-2023]
MLVPTILALLTCLLPSSLCAPAPFPNALALIEAQDDLTLIATLINRQPDLVTLFSTVKNVTIFAAPDYTFPNRDLDVPPFTNTTFVNAVLRQVVLEGIHPTRDFQPQPQYFKSKLTDPEYVNLSGGAAVGRIVKLNDTNNFRAAGGGSTSNVLNNGSNIAFEGGLLHKISFPVNPPADITSTFTPPGPADVAPNYSILNASAFGLLDTLTETQDVTLFALTNEAFTAAIKQYVTSNQCAGESVLQYLKSYAIAPGVYYGDSFDGRSVETLSGRSLTLAGVEKFPELSVDGRRVAVADIFVKNGVVHLLDE